MDIPGYRFHKLSGELKKFYSVKVNANYRVFFALLSAMTRWITLNADNPVASEILIPAKERSEVDWNTANRLVKENRNFLDYIELVRQFYQTGNPRAKYWDYEV